MSIHTTQRTLHKIHSTPTTLLYTSQHTTLNYTFKKKISTKTEERDKKKREARRTAASQKKQQVSRINNEWWTC